MEKKVTDIGGIFFKSGQPGQMKEWYKTHLGIDIGDSGAIFKFRDSDNPALEKLQVLSIFSENTTYFEPSRQSFMLNFIVDDLNALIEVLKSEGVVQIGEIEDYSYGKFAWVLDPDGNKIELWQPTG